MGATIKHARASTHWPRIVFIVSYTFTSGVINVAFYNMHVLQRE